MHRERKEIVCLFRVIQVDGRKVQTAQQTIQELITHLFLID